MTRPRPIPQPADDRVLSPAAANLYRIHAVAAHSWTTVLLEDKFGRFLVAEPRTGRLSEIDGETVARWLAERRYRAWNGDRGWAPLGHLPLLAAAPVDWQAAAAGGSESAL